MISGRRKSIVPYPEFEEFDIYLSESTFYDQEKVQGFARIVVKNFMANCVQDVVIECICDHIIYCENGTRYRDNLHLGLQRGGAPFESGGIPGGEYEIPFAFELPEGLPPSMRTSNKRFAGFYHEVKYQIRAYIVHAQIETFPRAHVRTSIPFQRRFTSVSGENEEGRNRVCTLVRGQKTFLFQAKKVLTMTAYCEKGEFQRGEPISFTVKIDNNSEKSVHSLTITGKQCVKSTIVGVGTQIRKHRILNQKIFLKGQRGVVGRGESFQREISVNLSRLEFGVVVVPENKKLICPSSQVSTKSASAEISYYLNIHCNVSFGSDLLIKLPFKIVEPPRVSSLLSSCDIERPPSYRAVSQLNTTEEWEEYDMLTILKFSHTKQFVNSSHIESVSPPVLPDYREVVVKPRKYSILSTSSFDVPFHQYQISSSSSSSTSAAGVSSAEIHHGSSPNGATLAPPQGCN
eukprot:Sdes_comp15723_c0_seq1m4759